MSTSARKSSTSSPHKKAAKPAVTVKAAGAHILSAPRGPRLVSHDQIKKAVTKVFRERHPSDG
jgi:hypothetical protein